MNIRYYPMLLLNAWMVNGIYYSCIHSFRATIGAFSFLQLFFAYKKHSKTVASEASKIKLTFVYENFTIFVCGAWMVVSEKVFCIQTHIFWVFTVNRPPIRTPIGWCKFMISTVKTLLIFDMRKIKSQTTKLLRVPSSDQKFNQWLECDDKHLLMSMIFMISALAHNSRFDINKL